jgi:hypothetical protein
MNARERQPMRVDVRGSNHGARLFTTRDHEVQHGERPTAVREARPLFVENFARTYSAAGEDGD